MKPEQQDPRKKSVVNGPFLSYIVSLFQNECKSHSYGNEFELHGNKPVSRTQFYMNSFAEYRFDTEAKVNSEMACSSPVY